MKKTLLIFTSTFPRWKNDTDPPFVYELAKRMTDKYKVHVVTPSYPGAKGREEMEGVVVYRYRYFFRPFEKLAGSTGIVPTIKKNKLYALLIPFFFFFGSLALLRKCLSIKPVLIHSHWIIPQGVMTLPTSIITKTPYLVTAHGADVFGLRRAYTTFFKRLCVKRAAHITTVSRALKDEIHRTIDPDCSCSIIPMGVDSNLFNPNGRSHWWDECENRPCKLLFVGRLSEKKGVTYLIDAMAQLIKDKVDVSLTIVGDGEEREKLEQQMASLSLENHITFSGAVENSNLPEIYRDHDIFIGPSIVTDGGDTEGFGLTFVEAAMCGCLIVGTDVGGISDIIEHRKTGLLIKEKSAQEIAASVQYCLKNRENAQEIARTGNKQCCAMFDWQHITRQYSDSFDEIIGREDS